MGRLGSTFPGGNPKPIFRPGWSGGRNIKDARLEIPAKLLDRTNDKNVYIRLCGLGFPSVHL